MIEIIHKAKNDAEQRVLMELSKKGEEFYEMLMRVQKKNGLRDLTHEEFSSVINVAALNLKDDLNDELSLIHREEFDKECREKYSLVL